MSLIKLAKSKKDDEIERLRVQLAGCGSAAIGYAGKVKKSDYGWSQSLQDVIDLYKEKENINIKWTELKKRYEIKWQGILDYIKRLNG